MEKKKDNTCFKCGKYGHFQNDCTSQDNVRSPWRNLRGGRQQQARGGARYQPQQHQRDNNSYNRGNGNYRGRGAGLRGRGGQQWQDRHNASQGATTFLTELEGKINKNIEVNNYENNLEWVLDSGCSDHIINNDKYFVKVNKLVNPINVKMGDGRTLKATSVGNIKAKFVTNYNETEIELTDVLYVKEMDRNLMSFGKVAGKAKIISVGSTSKIFSKDNKLIGVANKVNNLYKINTIFDSKQNYSSQHGSLYLSENVNAGMTLKEKYHRMLGHVNFKYLNTLSRNNLAEGLPNNLESEYLKCGTCIQNKMTNTSFENNRRRARDIGEIIHADVNGPHRTIGYRGEKYFLILIDDYSKAAKVYVMKEKSEVYDCIVTYVNLVENLTCKRIKRLRCDNGREFLNKDVYNFAKEKGIYIEPCPPYVHELNGTAERYNRSVMETARCLLADAKIHNRFWPEVIQTAVYLKNRTLANTYEKKTPYEIMMGEKPDIRNLKLYGSKVFVRVPEIKRRSKWDRKADLGVLVGYENVGYRVLINNRVIVAKHIHAIEESVNLVGFNENEEVNEVKTIENEINQNIELNEINEDNESKDDVPSTSNDNLKVVRRSERKKSPVNRYGNPVTNYVYVNYVSADNPESYNDAISSRESEKWREAMNKEIECLKKNDTWNLVEKPKDKKILDLKWVYTKRADNKFKARIVVRGFQQREIVDDIYSPVARTQTLKIMLNYCVQNDLIINQMDVESAFLNGKIKSEVYVKQPQGYDDNTERVCKLEKALYGLRESPRAWYECLDDYLRELGFEKSKIDYCVYFMEIGREKVYLITFVDDLLICSKKKKFIEFIKKKLTTKFKIKDMGPIKTYLGININYDYNKKLMTLDQENYIELLATKFEIENAKLYATPMEQNLKCEPALSVSSGIKYRNLMGALLYISSNTRPDICYSVNYLSRFQGCYDQSHYKYALRILKYLYYTKELKLRYEKNLNADILDCCVDADWAGDVVDRKSTTGYVIRMYGNSIYWKSKKQNIVTKSSTEAEYVALSVCVSEIKLIRELLKEFELEFKEPIRIYEDNAGAISISKFGNLTKNSKYIETHYHFVNENYLEGIIDVVKIESEANTADIFTKSLGRIKFETFRNNLKLL